MVCETKNKILPLADVRSIIVKNLLDLGISSVLSTKMKFTDFKITSGGLDTGEIRVFGVFWKTGSPSDLPCKFSFQ